MPTPGSPIFLLGYEYEANRTRIPIEWSQQRGQAVLVVPADTAAHPSIVGPALTFVIQGRATGGMP